MADQNTSLPVRSQADGTDERLHVKIVDGTNPDSNQASVDADKNLHIEMHGNNPAGTDTVLKLSESGNPAIDGLYNVSTNSVPASSALVAHTRGASPAISDQVQRITAITSSTVHALDIALHDESGASFTESNPLPVTVVDSEGSEVNDYATASAVAATASSNHDYTVTAGKTLKLTQVHASGSGKMKIEVQIETGVATGSFNSKFVQFNSTAEPNMLVSVYENIAVAAGVRVRVIMTNRDNQSQDLYSTICGHEI